MSITTDLASIRIIADIMQSQDLKKSFEELVCQLQQHVHHFDWVGLYLIQGGELHLEAASNMDNKLHWECNAELRIPIVGLKGAELGKIVVRSKQPICFDVTDVSTLNLLASEISNRLSVN